MYSYIYCIPLFGRILYWYFNFKYTPAIGGIRQVNRSMMGIYNFLCNAQAKPIVVFIRPGRITGIKTLKYFFFFTIRNTTSMVDYRENHFPSLHPCA